MTLIDKLSYDGGGPKAPRWINTEAGQWAWQHLVAWRGKARLSLGVQERRQLLEEAEQLQQAGAMIAA